MTTSNANSTSATSRPEAKNWQELTRQFAPESTLNFAAWLDAQLIALEESQKKFVTNRTLIKSLRRS
jgi:hypothetical protein